MAKFSDLQFEPFRDGVAARVSFPNGFGASVVRHTFSYGGQQGLYELAVLKDRDIHYDNPVAKGDVLGWLNPENIDTLLQDIENL